MSNRFKSPPIEICAGIYSLRRKRNKFLGIQPMWVDWTESAFIGRFKESGEPFLVTTSYEGQRFSCWYGSRSFAPSMKRSIGQKIADDYSLGSFNSRVVVHDLRKSDESTSKQDRAAISRSYFNDVWVAKYRQGWHQEHIVLNAPYEERMEVKVLGAQFDRVLLKWRVRNQGDLSSYVRWIQPATWSAGFRQDGPEPKGVRTGSIVQTRPTTVSLGQGSARGQWTNGNVCLTVAIGKPPISENDS